MRKSISLLFLTACLFMAQTVFGAAEYDIIQLKSDQEKTWETAVSAVSENGFILGTVSEESWDTESGYLFVYHKDLGFKELRNMPPGADGIAINNNGVIAGTFSENDPIEFWDRDDQAFIYDVKSDNFITLGTFGFDSTDVEDLQVLSLSDSGLLLASIDIADEHDRKYILYDINTGEFDSGIPEMPIATDRHGRILGMSPYIMDDLLKQGGYYYISNLLNVTEPTGIKLLPFVPTTSNDYGVVAGIGYDGFSESPEGRIWSKKDNHITAFSLTSSQPDDDDLHKISEAAVCGINNLGQIAGIIHYQSRVEGEPKLEKVFFYDPDKGTTEIGLEVDGWFVANDLNNRGEVVGHYESEPDEVEDGYWDYDQTAFIWDADNGLHNLDELIPSDSGWEILKTAMNFNDSGMIIGKGIYEGKEYGFVLVPKETAF